MISGLASLVNGFFAAHELARLSSDQRTESKPWDRGNAETLSSRRARGDAEGFFDRGRIVNLSAFDHGGDVAGVANVLRRVAVDEDHVG